MVYLNNKKAIAGLLLGAGARMAVAAPAPAITAAPSLKDAQINKRGDSCTFSDASAASESKSDCATIILSGITVPAGMMTPSTSTPFFNHSLCLVVPFSLGLSLCL